MISGCERLPSMLSGVRCDALGGTIVLELERNERARGREIVQSSTSSSAASGTTSTFFRRLYRLGPG